MERAITLLVFASIVGAVTGSWSVRVGFWYGAKVGKNTVLCLYCFASSRPLRFWLHVWFAQLKPNGWFSMNQQGALDFDNSAPAYVRLPFNCRLGWLFYGNGWAPAKFFHSWTLDDLKAWQNNEYSFESFVLSRGRSSGVLCVLGRDIRSEQTSTGLFFVFLTEFTAILNSKSAWSCNWCAIDRRSLKHFS